MSQRQKKRLVLAIFIIALSLFALERLYNSQNKFNAKAKEASYYDIVEVGMTNKEKLQDFKYMYEMLETNYPYFKVNERLHNINWLENKKHYKRLIRNTKSDAEFYIAMDMILSDLNNGNTSILDGNTFKHLYKVNYPNWDYSLGDFRVMYRYNFNGDVRSVEFDKEPVLETKILIDDELAYMKIKSMSYYHVEEDYIKIKTFLNEAKDCEKLIIDIRGNSGGLDDYWKNIVGLLIDEPLSTKYYSFFKDGYRNKHDTYKVEGVDAINNLDKAILKELPEELKTDFTFYKTYQLEIRPLDKVDFNGKIYLLVDKQVFSSAEKFASFAKDTGFATLVGETTGGNRTFEDIPVFFLPKSKFVIRYDRELGLNLDGTINMEKRTTPDFEVNSIPNEDFMKDECIQEVIKHN